MGFLVLPIYLVGRIPFVCGLVECEAHIVSAVAFILKSARSISVIVDDIDAHNVSVAESFVIRSCGIFLIDPSGDHDRLEAFFAF